MHVSHESPGQTQERLLAVLGRAELRVLEGTYAFAEHRAATIPLPTERTLALVRDDDMWSVLREASAADRERLRVFLFHFPAEIDNSGFIGWLAGHLKAAVGTGVLVICGCNGRRGGVFDCWCVPERIGEEAVAEVHRLRTSAA
jgi:hypothetical protein